MLRFAQGIGLSTLSHQLSTDAARPDGPAVPAFKPDLVGNCATSSHFTLTAGGRVGFIRKMVPSVLIVDDEKHTREGLQQALQEHYDVSVAGSADEAFNLMDASEFEVIITDLRMPGKSGLKVIDKALMLPNKPAVLMMTAYGNIESAVEAMKRGAVDFLTKPVQIDRLEILIQRALKTKTLEVEVKQLHERLDEKFSVSGIVGHSLKLAEVIERVKLVAPSKATILIEGETGTGKELIAQAIHQASPR